MACPLQRPRSLGLAGRAHVQDRRQQQPRAARRGARRRRGALLHMASVPDPQGLCARRRDRRLAHAPGGNPGLGSVKAQTPARRRGVCGGLCVAESISIRFEPECLASVTDCKYPRRRRRRRRSARSVAEVDAELLADAVHEAVPVFGAHPAREVARRPGQQVVRRAPGAPPSCVSTATRSGGELCPAEWRTEAPGGGGGCGRER